MNRGRQRRKANSLSKVDTVDMDSGDCIVPEPTRLVDSIEVLCNIEENKSTEHTDLDSQTNPKIMNEASDLKEAIPEAEEELPSTSTNEQSDASAKKKRKLESSDSVSAADEDSRDSVSLEAGPTCSSETPTDGAAVNGNTVKQQSKKARLQTNLTQVGNELEESFEDKFEDAMESLLGNEFPPFSPPRITGLTGQPTNSAATASVTPTTLNVTQDDITIVAEVQAARPEIIDLETTPTLRRGSSFVVDLTGEPNSPDRDVVDLTSENFQENADLSPVIVCVSRIFQRAPSITWQRPSCMFETVPSDALNRNVSPPQLSDDDILEVTEESPPTTSSSGVSSSSGGSADTPKKSITCPICMDDERTIKRRKRQLTSTVCGHVFCDQCIKNAVKIQSKCPTCRKKLTLRQLHPIFI